MGEVPLQVLEDCPDKELVVGDEVGDWEEWMRWGDEENWKIIVEIRAESYLHRFIKMKLI